MIEFCCLDYFLWIPVRINRTYHKYGNIAVMTWYAIFLTILTLWNFHFWDNKRISLSIWNLTAQALKWSDTSVGHQPSVFYFYSVIRTFLAFLSFRTINVFTWADIPRRKKNRTLTVIMKTSNPDNKITRQV